MIDLHTHILPGVDDGSRNLEESMEMCRIASACGTRGIVATSHGNLAHGNSGAAPLTVQEYKNAYRLLKQELKQENIPVRLYSGMEIFMSADVTARLDAGELLTLNQTRYVLVEFDFQEEAWMAEEYLHMLEDAGYIPVIAHVERYYFIQKSPEIIYDWAQRGYVIQVNKGSLLGAFGKKERDISLSLMEHNLIHVIASDAHGTQRRTPNMRNIVRFLDETVGSKYRSLVLNENPARILSGEEILSFPPRPYRRNRHW